jgi:hypothetical protein
MSSSDLTKFLREKLDLVILSASIAPLSYHVPDHAKEFAHVADKELVVVFNYALQIFQTLLHRLHGLETFVDRRVEIRDGVTASRTTHRMQSEWVVIAIVSTIVCTVIAAVVTGAVGAFGSLLLGHLIPNVKVVIISSGGRPQTRATIVGVVATPIILRLG